MPHHQASALEHFGPILLTLVAASIYLVLSRRQRNEPRGWSRWRTAAFLAGCCLLVVAFWPLSPFPESDFRTHMIQHLLLGMYAPVGLVMGAPLTLLLRSLRPASRRPFARALRSRTLHVLANPIVALTLNLGGLALLYFTPLYRIAAENPLLHLTVHCHFILAGYVFAWTIAGPDPAPRRPSVRTRLILLGVAIAGHAVLSQLLYGGLFTDLGGVPAAERRGGGELMYYGGDIGELILALALLTGWRPALTGRRSARSTARTGLATSAGGR